MTTGVIIVMIVMAGIPYFIVQKIIYDLYICEVVKLFDIKL